MSAPAFARPVTLDLLFVYGTLRSGSRSPEAARLADESEPLGPAWWQGRLFQHGCFPAALRAAGDQQVRGDLVRLRDREATFAWLDEYEDLGPAVPRGEAFRREEQPVVLGGGRAVRAWMYRYLGTVATDHEIPHGDWLKHLAERGAGRAP